MDPRGSGQLSITKEEAARQLPEMVARLAGLQEQLYAHDRWGVLLIFQAMDAAGKDSVIKHVLSGVNPQGCQVASFKVPSAEELGHDFLWRTTARLPERGRIGVFNRSYYEEVLVVRVHPELLGSQKLPESLVTPKIWKERFEDISTFERHLARSGFVIRKFFLNVSRDEQRQRFLDRLDEPAKRWKFSLGDVHERQRWDDYMRAYEDMIRHTSSPHAPWIVVPADRKWFAHHVVAAAIVEALEQLDLKLPKMTARQRRDLTTARRQLEQDKSS
jgi:PPK2 family polyphosphate:nucleotide phosphotransferase